MYDWSEPTGPYWIRYHFALSDGRSLELHLTLDPFTLESLEPLPAEPPAWARLGYRQCTGCPLSTQPHCPAAARLSSIVPTFAAAISHEAATVRVETPEREVRLRTSMQVALSSFLGAHLVTSGCPVLGRLRPMVRFHLPFATMEETVFRAVSTYLVGQYLRQGEGEEADWSLAGLTDLYRQLEDVNQAFAARLRGAVEQDAAPNAIVHLDLFAKALPALLEERLGMLRPLFRGMSGK